jgi:hypothetical protein
MWTYAGIVAVGTVLLGLALLAVRLMKSAQDRGDKPLGDGGPDASGMI